MTVLTHFAGAGLIAGATIVAACNSSAPAQRAAEEPAAGRSTPPPAEIVPAAAATPRVFFVEPADGASVKSPVKLRFGVEGLQVAPVPAGEVTTARAGMGHHHVGVDTECLPPGTVIPKAAPWIHFGDGKSEIEMQLPKGTHKLALEIGDDLHTTIAGLCTTITLNVTE